MTEKKDKHESTCDRCRRADRATEFIKEMGGPNNLHNLEAINPKLVKKLAHEFGIEL